MGSFAPVLMPSLINPLDSNRLDSWALQSRRGISAAAALAAVIIVTAGVTAAYLYPTLAGGKAVGDGSSTTTITSTTTFPTTTSSFPTSYSTTTFFSSSNTTLYPFTTAVSTAGGWQTGTVANMTLYYYKVLPLVKVAYNYSLYISQTGASPVLISAIVGLYGPMIMRGNWTTGYSFSFPYRSVLNVPDKTNGIRQS